MLPELQANMKTPERAGPLTDKGRPIISLPGTGNKDSTRANPSTDEETAAQARPRTSSAKSKCPALRASDGRSGCAKPCMDKGSSRWAKSAAKAVNPGPERKAAGKGKLRMDFDNRKPVD